MPSASRSTSNQEGQQTTFKAASGGSMYVVVVDSRALLTAVSRPPRTAWLAALSADVPRAPTVVALYWAAARRGTGHVPTSWRVFTTSGLQSIKATEDRVQPFGQLLHRRRNASSHRTGRQCHDRGCGLFRTHNGLLP